MERLASGEISQVEMNVFHALMYKTNHVVDVKEWKSILRKAYVWIDWASMPQPSASPNASKEKKKTMGTNLGKAVKSIPAYVLNFFSIYLQLIIAHIYIHTLKYRYVEKADFVAIVAPGCLHADRRDKDTKIRAKTCFRTYRKRGWCVLEVFASFLSREKKHPILLISSAMGQPEWLSTLEVQKLSIGLCDFTCCQRNHTFPGIGVVPCDRGICRYVFLMFSITHPPTHTHTHTHTYIHTYIPQLNP
ncbi:hypothetical protein OAV88_03805 [bacterium]|nr:hypothetical protein [bacterium]